MRKFALLITVFLFSACAGKTPKPEMVSKKDFDAYKAKMEKREKINEVKIKSAQLILAKHNENIVQLMVYREQSFDWLKICFLGQVQMIKDVKELWGDMKKMHPKYFKEKEKKNVKEKNKK